MEFDETKTVSIQKFAESVLDKIDVLYDNQQFILEVREKNGLISRKKDGKKEE